MSILARLGLKKQTAPDRTLIPTSKATAARIKNILGIRHLEPMPAQAARAFQLASNPRATGAQFVEVIESDEVISARVVRIANSVYFFRGTPATDIEKAVANIGLDELRCLLSATMLKSLLKGKHPAREQVWANAVGTAIAARRLSCFTTLSEGEAFLCGLVHDVGKLIMIQRNGGLYEEVIKRVSSGDLSFVEAEEELFETNHTEVGKWVAESWNFPPQTLEAITRHHESWPKPSAHSVEKVSSPALVVKAADAIVHAQGIGHSLSMRPFKARMAEEQLTAFALLGVPEADRATLIDNITAGFDREFALYQLEAG